MANNSSNCGSTDSKDSRWYFTADQLTNSPSRRHGIDADQELSFRQLTAYLIQEMGQRLQVSQLCINTAIVYMHRFYAFHSFTHFHRNGIAAASLFLAAKVEEQPRKLEHVIKVAHLCLNQEPPHPSTDLYAEQAQDLVFNENVLLQTLGFDVAIDHPHTHVVKTCHLVKACKDLAQTSYFLASNSLHLTPMCLQYRPTVVACFCIYLACKWSRWEIPQSTEGKHWFHYVDRTVTMDLLKQLTDEFIAIYEKSPARLKSKLNSIKALAQGARISEPSRPMPESSNSASSQLAQLEPVRRSDSYSSHHRTHHSSTSLTHPGAPHHHHSKQLSTNEIIGEHLAVKSSSSHKQPYPSSASGSHSNRPRTERSQPQNDSQYNMPVHTNKQLPQNSNSRPNSSGRPSHGPSAPNSATSSSQRSIPHTHDPNYHKNRNTLPAQLNPAMPGHKIIPKLTDPQRQIIKDPSGRTIDPNKVSTKHSSNNIYNIPNTVNTGIDMTRNLTQSVSNVPVQQQQQQQQQPQQQQQRPYLSGNAQPPNYNQAISNRNNTTNTKYDQSVQQQTHLHPIQKQSIESSYSTTNTRQIEEGVKSGDNMEICSPPKYPYLQMPQQTVQLQQQQQQQNKPSSIFSPEWNDKASQHSNIPSINSSSNGNNKPIGLTIKSSRDSPKKDRERRSETPKKDKIRSDMINPDQTKVSQIDKRSAPSKKLSETPNMPQNVISSIPFDMKNQQHNILNLSAGKRSLHGNECGIKIEDELHRENKIRKIEPQSPPKINDQRINMPYSYDQHLSNEHRSMKPFPPTVNGIETNPDLVSSLLKESLCNDSKFATTALIKNEPLEPIEMIDTPLDQTTTHHNLNIEINVPDDSKLGNDEYSKSKTEKKKKKDKHKHKEKDKSKDKEEKKKHKKDKDKHKDRDRSSGTETEQNPFKIKISKDKLNLPLLETTNPPTSDLKLKIPKDKIKGELTNYQVDENIVAQSVVPSSGLKIKISKDKIENYNNQQSSSGSYGSNASNFHTHSSSSKKKDRDRERDKDKKRNSNEYNKQNGSGNNNNGTSGIPSGSSNKSQSSTKMQQFTNMSQLFGDSNDDDNLLPPQKTMSSSHQSLSRYSHSDSNKYYQQQQQHQQQQIGGNYYSKQ